MSNAVRKHFANDFRKLCFYIVSNQTRRAFESVKMILQRLIHKVQNHLGRFMFGIEREHLIYELSCCHTFEFFLPSSFSTSLIMFYGWQKFVCNRLVVIGRHQLDIRLDGSNYGSLIRSARCAADRMSFTSSGEGREGKGSPRRRCPPPLPPFSSLFLPLLTFSDESFVVTISQHGNFVV